jgi:hypothetical protein
MEYAPTSHNRPVCASGLEPHGSLRHILSTLRLFAAQTLIRVVKSQYSKVIQNYSKVTTKVRLLENRNHTAPPGLVDIILNLLGTKGLG